MAVIKSNRKAKDLRVKSENIGIPHFDLLILSFALKASNDSLPRVLENQRGIIMDNKLIDGIIPEQPPVDAHSDVHALKSRLEWGEPAFTILDVRDRQTYNEGHIMGAMPMPVEDLVYLAESSLQKSRDIYIYGTSESDTAEAAQMLRNAGFVHVSELRGGLPAWKAIGGPTEGIIESMTPAGADDYNVVARMKNHLETQQKEV